MDRIIGHNPFSNGLSRDPSSVGFDRKMDPEELLEFWFDGLANDAAGLALRSKMWFRASDQFDHEIARRFGAAVARASDGNLDGWAVSPRTSLALVILLDQFPRNVYRGSERAFSLDSKALEITLASLDRGFHLQLRAAEECFLLIPLQHAEDQELQQRSVACFEDALSRAPEGLRPALEGFLLAAMEHRGIVQRFGRFPHRNELLHRTSAPEELEFLSAGASSFGQR